MQEPARPWDARLARRLIAPFGSSRLTPNHLTTVRLLIGLASALAFAEGGYLWANIGAALLVLSNFADHTDGELARLSGKSSRLGHFYDLASDALVTVGAFFGIGAGVVHAAHGGSLLALWLGALAGGAIALIFYLRLLIERAAGKAATRQPRMAGFEAEDVLYLMPLVTLANITYPFLIVAAIGAPLGALIVAIQYWRGRASSGGAPNVAQPVDFGRSH
ncbi:MAG: CDP-alcohol phosphatidyltransferase family protein [Janthinobacterium lividum]